MADDELALVRAALRRNVPALKAALSGGADPMQAAPGGLTALHAAAMRGLAEAVPLLVAAGAAVDARMTSRHAAGDFLSRGGFKLPRNYVFTDDDATPLHLAASEGRGAAVTALLAAVADPNAEAGAGWTPLAAICQRLHGSRTLLAAAVALVAGGADCLRTVPPLGADFILERMDRPGRRPVLQRVYEQQRWRGARRSGRRGPRGAHAPPALDPDQLGRALAVAAKDGSAEAACWFLQQLREEWARAAAPPPQEAVADTHLRLLMHAAGNADERVLTALLEAGVGEGAAPDDLAQALHTAAAALHCRAVASLLQRGAPVELGAVCNAVQAALEAAAASFGGGNYRAPLRRGLGLLRLLLAHGRPQVPLGAPGHPVSVRCCPFYVMLCLLHRGGGGWRRSRDGTMDRAWGWNWWLRRAPRELLRLAEALVGAGYRPAVFTACYLPRYQSDVLEECCPFDDQAERGGHITQMVELTAWQVAWEPQLHARFPAAFRAAARTLLLAQRREDDGRAAAAAAADGSRRRQRGAARQCGSSAAHSHGNNPLALLSADLVLRIIGHAAHPLSAWL